MLQIVQSWNHLDPFQASSNRNIFVWWYSVASIRSVTAILLLVSGSPPSSIVLHWLIWQRKTFELEGGGLILAGSSWLLNWSHFLWLLSTGFSGLTAGAVRIRCDVNGRTFAETRGCKMKSRSYAWKRTHVPRSGFYVCTVLWHWLWLRHWLLQSFISTNIKTRVEVPELITGWKLGTWTTFEKCSHLET